MPREDLIQLRRGTAAEWTAANPVLALGEYGFETDTRQSKIGNGTDNWNDLDYLAGASAAVLWGDITGTLSDQTDLQSALDNKEDKIGSTAYTTLTGAVNIDVSTLDNDTYYLLTGNTTVTWTNTPAVNETVIRSFKIRSQTAETLTLPAADISKGTFDNDGAEHQIAIMFSNFPTEGLKIVQFINKA